MRALIRDAGSGLEYDLDDVVILRFVHQTRRHLLVPLYLELPLVRMRTDAARTPAASQEVLPEVIRHTEWALRGCQLHASHFDQFEAVLDEEVRRWSHVLNGTAREVTGLLRSPRQGESAIKAIQPPYYAATRRLAAEASTSAGRVHDRQPKCEHPPGVNIFGYFYSDIGVGKSTRGLAKALSLLRPVNAIPLCTSQLREGTQLQQLFQHFNYMSDTNVFVSYPHQAEDLLGMTRREQLVGRRNIVHLAWEQKDGNPLWKRVFDRYDEIWTISDFAAVPLRKLFPGRVKVVPNVLDFEQFPSFEDAATNTRQEEIVNFLFAFDANSSIERKNPEGVIDAFIIAFEGTADAARVRLTLKVGSMHRAEHAERIAILGRKAAASKLDIQFDDRQLGRDAMLQLIFESDCYVSLHHAEGFGYTMAEAMYYGVPVIASGYSGNLEHMTSDNSFLVPCQEAFVKTPDGPFQLGSIWGEPDLGAAASHMRSVVEMPEEARAVGRRGRKTVIELLSAHAIAEKVRTSLDGGGLESMRVGKAGR